MPVSLSTDSRAALPPAQNVDAPNASGPGLSPIRVRPFALASARAILGFGRINERDASGKTRLHHAVERSDFPEAWLLLQAGASPERPTSGTMPQTPLQMAAWRGHADIARLPLGTGRVNANAADRSGSTALHKACTQSHADVVRVRLNCPGIRAGCSDHEGLTPLHLAVLRGSADVVRRLLDAPELEVNCQDPDGNTALHVAARQGGATIAALLTVPEINANLAY